MRALRDAVRPVDELFELVADAQLVLLGEATHGTHEFYEIRAALTRRLIAERSFRGVAVEADWPAAARVNSFVQRAGDDSDAETALSGFVRFPRWMWRNDVIVELIEWLREHGGGAGFYGLDLYSLRESMSAVVDYLDQIDSAAAARARRRYGCFDDFDDQAYGYATARGDKEPCEDAVVGQLEELRERAAELAARDGRLSPDAHFAAQQNARLAAGAERYYRMMFRGRASTWNLRDTHMADTLDALREHLGGAGIVVWAHNSHVGDARATSMGAERGELNLGQLARERHGDDVRIVGFTTHAGTVTAASDWDAPAQCRRVRPSLAGSVERLLHEAGIGCGVLDLRGGALHDERLQRMIGVIYRPDSERHSHYLMARPGEQFDALVHVDETTALQSLDRFPQLEGRPDTVPSGM
jgi:erythromycin esterase-like protein